MKTVYIDQHGRFGDILFTIPIVKRLEEKGYEVKFYINSRYKDLIDHFPDVNFKVYEGSVVPLPKEPCMLLPLWHAKQYLKEKGDFSYNDLMTGKYKMYNDVFNDNINQNTYWHSLKFKRFPEKEKKLMEILKIKEEDKYVLINENYHWDKKIEIKIGTSFKKIYMNKINGFDLIDWSLVLENAKEIHTVETSIMYLVDRLKTTDKLFLYPRKIENVKVSHLLSKKYVRCEN
jgi:hypothetical protein